MQAAVPRSSNRRTFFFDSRDTHVFNALVAQGWTPVSRGPVLLRYTASDVGNGGAVQAFSIGNHLRFTRAITNKEGLAQTLGNFSLLTKISIDEFFPRQVSEISDLHVLYSRYAAYLRLRCVEATHGTRQVREISDLFLERWLSEICPEISSFFTVTRALRALEAADPQLSLLGEEISDPVFVIKPGASSRGSGVFFSDRWEEISAQISDLHRVVQLAVARPLLCRDRKFDLRVWVLVRQRISDLDFFIYQNFYARLCPEKFSGQSLCRAELVTNWSVNKQNFDKISDSVALSPEIISIVGEEIFRLAVWPAIRHIVACTLQAGYLEICGEERVGNFELLGFDIIIDKQNFRPWLLEVNASPACDASRAPDLAQVADHMASGLVRLISGADEAVDGWERGGHIKNEEPAKSRDWGVALVGTTLSKRQLRKIDRLFEGDRALETIKAWFARCDVLKQLRYRIKAKINATAAIQAATKAFLVTNKIRATRACYEIQFFVRARFFRYKLLEQRAVNFWRHKLRNRQQLCRRLIAAHRFRKRAALYIETFFGAVIQRKRRQAAVLSLAAAMRTRLLRRTVEFLDSVARQEFAARKILRGLLEWHLRLKIRQVVARRSLGVWVTGCRKFLLARRRVQAAIRSGLMVLRMVRRSEISRNFRAQFPALVGVYATRRRLAQAQIVRAWRSHCERKFHREIYDLVIACVRKFKAQISLLTARRRLACLRTLVRNRVARKRESARKFLVAYFRSFFRVLELDERRQAREEMWQAAALKISGVFQVLVARGGLERQKFLLSSVQVATREYLDQKTRAVATIGRGFRQLRVRQKRRPVLAEENKPPMAAPEEKEYRKFLETSEAEEDAAELMAALVGEEQLTDRKFYAPRQKPPGDGGNLERQAKSLLQGGKAQLRPKKRTSAASLRRSKLTMALI